jgi:probable rRNA maturation factor
VSIEIANESGMPVDEQALAGLARHVLDSLRVHPLAELSVLLVDEPAITELHVHWMGEPGPTDVLAFPMDELRPPQPGGGAEHGPAAEPPGTPALLGDVVICPQVAAAQAKAAQQPVRDEIDLLCTHGILHLLGYDHAEPDDRAAMFGLQDRLLQAWRAGQPQEPGPAAELAGRAGQDRPAPADGGGRAGRAAPGGRAGRAAPDGQPEPG